MRSNRIAQENGQGLVEFALILPFLLILILGVVDIGRALGYKNDMTSLASQAARIAAVNSCASCPTGAGHPNPLTEYITGIAPTELKNGSAAVDPIQISYTMVPDPSTGYSGCKGDAVTVTVSTNYRWLSFLVGKSAVPGSQIGMSSSATMRLEANYDPTSLSNIYTATANHPPAGCPS